MEKRELFEGDILQINPNHERFPGFLLIVTESKSWGAQGYLMHSRDFDAYKYNGRAFLRVKFEEVEYCATIYWIESNNVQE